MKQRKKFLILHGLVLVWKKPAIYPYKALSSPKIAGTWKKKKAFLPAFMHR